MLISARSYDEYVAMFDLRDEDLGVELLDCAAGAAGFTAEINVRGGHARAVDPAYAQDTGTLTRIAREHLGDCLRMMQRKSEAFVWDWYGDVGRREEMRRRAAEAFVEDLTAHRDRYLAGELPYLPPADGEFDLALCSHFLFTWQERFDRDWHLAALRELARVAAEVRVFPLFGHTDQGPYPHLAWLRERLEADGLTTEIREVPYEFQRGANEMLVLSA